MTDLFSKFAVAVPTKDQSAETTARALYNNLVQTFGCPERILTDRGAAFESNLISQLCQLYGCQKSRTTAYHPQGNGACERFNQTLLGLLGSLEEVQQAQWPNKLPTLLQAYNNTVHSSTGFTPYYLVFGRHARLPVDWATGLQPPIESHTLEGWVKTHQGALSYAYRVAKQKKQHRQEQDRVRYNGKHRLPPLLPGERVLIRNFRRREKGKLAPKWDPKPFVIVAPIRENHPVYIVRPEGRERPTRTIHRNNLRPCPLNMSQQSPDIAPRMQEQPGTELVLPPPTWWLPELVTPEPASSVTPALGPVPDIPPEPLEVAPPRFRRSQRANIGIPPARYCE